MILLGISGKRRSGKTLLATMLADQYGFTHLSLAGPLKDICKGLFDLSESEVNGADKETPSIYGLTPRQIMIDTGKFFRSIDHQFWIKQVKAQVMLDKAAKYVISDIRFKNEADWVKSQDGYLVRLERAVELTGEPINDPSEMELDFYNGFSFRVPESCNVDKVDMQITVDTIAAELLCNK